MDISEANLTGPPAHWTSLNFLVEEASEVLGAQRIRRPTYLSMGRLQKQADKGLVVPLKNPVESPVVFGRKKSTVHHDCLTLHQSNYVSRWESWFQAGSTAPPEASVEEN
jgi:hypothetical protein